MVNDTRVVLVKPGDVLVFGNVGDIGDLRGLGDTLRDLKENIGLAQIVIFSGDIDLASISANQ